AIHRGFYSMNKGLFRNPPMWEIPIELKRAIPNIPILVDPSHICGSTKLIQHISQKAIDLEMDGLMIESHFRPWSALSDADQQIRPKHLDELLKNLVIRKPFGGKVFQNKLSKLRAQIDEIDDELIEILTKRILVVKEIGEYKKDHKITILQLKRWSYIIEDRMKKGIDGGLEKAFLSKLLEVIHDESMRIQADILNSEIKSN
ncbi:MAG: bifunctional 3-deoxy-7-phosphoheptulonate synthase/chorismate mutase type II, partial [Candidatus Heimdallarchaeota archaeon]|nr:bifunctional 3-deoxy-7-phosphoheptulonate synthase/chorismate mutase type II [Candidatus Heimdallarchaeota archaeon]